MKTVPFILALSMFPLFLYSQGFGIRGGLNFVNMKLVESYVYEDGDKTTDRVRGKVKTGFTLDVNYDVNVGDNMYLQLALGFSQKGYRTVDKDDDYKAVSKTKLNYVEVPLAFKYSKSLKKDINIFGKLGTYFGYGISSKESWKTIDDTEEESGESSENLFGDDVEEHLFKPLDIGFKIGGGMMYKNIEIGLDYGFSIMNFSLFKDTSSEGRSYSNVAKNRVLSVSIGYRFNN